MTGGIHPTAIVEEGVTIGPGTTVWDHVHIRAPARIGSSCIIGEKTYIAYGVEIGDLVKMNAFVYVCTGVRIEKGVMVSAGTVFTNDRFPRATDNELRELRSSAPDDNTRPTLVREGATLGARSVIGCDLEIGRFAMTGMGSVVTRSVPAFHLVVGSPARTIAYVCRCGEPFFRIRSDTVSPTSDPISCRTCGLRYSVRESEVIELQPPD